MEVFDGHCDTILRCYLEGGGFRERPGHLDLTRTRKFSRYAQFFACFGEPEDMPGRPLWEVFQEEVALFRREMEQNADRVVFCRSGREAEAAFAGGRAAAFLSAEGAELLDCDLDKLRQAHAWGVRAVNLTWNHPNALSGTNAEERERGLSSKGRAFVREMQRLGMLVDVSHLSDPGFWDVMEIAEKPIFASHSNARDVFFDTRNLTDAQFTAIIKKHGIVGLNCYAAFLGQGNVTKDTLLRHLEHFLALGGEKTVALGGDWDGCSKLPEGFSGAWNWLDFYEYLLQKNYSESLLRDLYFNNLMRTVRAVCTI